MSLCGLSVRCIVFANLKPGQTRILSGRKWVWGRSVYVSALRLEDGELLIVVSPDSTTTAISDYGKRWGIETLFGMLRELRSPVVRCSASEFPKETWTAARMRLARSDGRSVAKQLRVRDDDLRVRAALEDFALSLLISLIQND